MSQFFEEGCVCLYIPVESYEINSIENLSPKVALIKSFDYETNLYTLLLAGGDIKEKVNEDHLATCDMLPELFARLLQSLLSNPITVISKDDIIDVNDNFKNETMH